ncbi:S-adenosylmethionine:tRNA ribosyltransferase-isomerase [Methylopila jiangsuensis]|uniref:S-adenosylmethionine:tRNA ribosyltransferase-isomerase n=1 Tax=Methylopila jiangsuensis TaxID=586230 RepID=A0A9W6JDW6_9HYPH|nr:tRNA preQ1(34) S-adenosylmethionine ribosyltransferase-isomerase QueA [Methylopila jiangsuensis]MDR6285429.1 S-adenosylmethionine:tRNA ribosyltransferase-isomerase [Methylopila jiangsuensis]GLK75187.1 S-adenosylmethionine:tRNA ribosyltransferase-isomerase [Methylopila jiangsuensis]
MDVSLFDFDLPEDRIALRPASPRDSARLLVVRPGAETELEDRLVSDLPDLLAPGDALAVNATRVIPARLRALRRRGGTVAKVEILLHQRLDGARWKAFARPAKKLGLGERVEIGEGAAPLSATVEARGDGGEVTLAFDRAGPDLDAAIAALGELPLPPYIGAKRGVDARDADDYQTLFAREAGAVAAPTAGLHFTPRLVEAIAARGVSRHETILHVGAGTFLPVKAEDTDDHRMHFESGTLDAATAEALNAARDAGGRLVAVGTTSCRLLESAVGPDGRLAAFAGETDIFITPGFRFRAVDALLTNFHLPRSTLMMLVSAFAGLDVVRRAYAHAVAGGYRFYSYGDACLFLPKAPRP